MCGLIGWINSDRNDDTYSATDMVAEQYEEQKDRGTRGFGMVEIFDDGSTRISRATGEVKMMVDLRMSDAKHILLHHRQPTASENMIDQTHPILIENKELEFDYLVMHNGVITNAKELKPLHEALGYVYLTEHDAYEYKSSTNTVKKFNDSEAFAIELVRFLERKTDVISSFGNQAFITVQLDKETGLVTKLFIGTNGGNPMVLAHIDKAFFFASELNFLEQVKFVAGQAATFIPTYKDGVLEGFKELKDLPELNFATRPVPAIDTTKRHSDIDDDNYYVGRRFGFGAPSVAPSAPYKPVDGVPARGMDFITVSDARLIMGEAGKGLNDKDVMEAAIAFRNRNPDKTAPKPADAPKALDAGSYARVLFNLRNSALGSIFDHKMAKEHDIFTGFQYDEFAKQFAAGNITDVEEAWTKYFEDQIVTELDFASVVEEALMITPDFRNVKSLEEMEKRALRVVGDQMAHMASSMLPIFKLHAFMGMAITLGHAYTDLSLKGIQTARKVEVKAGGSVNGVEKTEAEVDDDIKKSAAEAFDSKKCECDSCKNGFPQYCQFKSNIDDEVLSAKEEHDNAWGHLHIIADCKQPQFHKANQEDDIEKHFLAYGKHDISECDEPKLHAEYWDRLRKHNDYYGSGHRLSDCKADLYHMADPPKGSKSVVIPNESDPDEDADTALQVLGEQASEMQPDEILQEAEHVAHGIRMAASVQIEEQLSKMAMVASENGLTLHISKHEDIILNAVGRATERFTKLASIVKTAKEVDDYVYGNHEENEA